MSLSSRTGDAPVSSGPASAGPASVAAPVAQPLGAFAALPLGPKAGMSKKRAAARAEARAADQAAAAPYLEPVALLSDAVRARYKNVALDAAIRELKAVEYQMVGLQRQMLEASDKLAQARAQHSMAKMQAAKNEHAKMNEDFLAIQAVRKNDLRNMNARMRRLNTKYRAAQVVVEEARAALDTATAGTEEEMASAGWMLDIEGRMARGIEMRAVLRREHARYVRAVNDVSDAKERSRAMNMMVMESGFDQYTAANAFAVAREGVEEATNAMVKVTDRFHALVKTYLEMTDVERYYFDVIGADLTQLVELDENDRDRVLLDITLKHLGEAHDRAMYENFPRGERGVSPFAGYVKMAANGLINMYFEFGGAYNALVAIIGQVGEKPSQLFYTISSNLEFQHHVQASLARYKYYADAGVAEAGSA